MATPSACQQVNGYGRGKRIDIHAVHRLSPGDTQWSRRSAVRQLYEQSRAYDQEAEQTKNWINAKNKYKRTKKLPKLSLGR